MPGRAGAFTGVFVQSFRAITMTLLALGFASAALAAPTRIVSTSLCGDGYVLALAEPQNIAALSWQADTKLSSAPETLRKKKRGRADAERLVALGPDLVVLGPGDLLRSTTAVQKAGANVIALNWVEDFKGVFNNIEALGVALDRQTTAQKSIARIKARLAILENRHSQNQVRPRVLYLMPGGAGAGEGVFVDHAIRAAGGINHGATLGIKGWGKVPLEKLALDPPDLILTSFFNTGYPSVVDMRSRHPLLVKALKSIPTAHIPARHWVCAGPHLIDAAEAIANALGKAHEGGS